MIFSTPYLLRFFNQSALLFLNMTFGKDPCYLEDKNQKQQAIVFLCAVSLLPPPLDCCIRGFCVSSEIINMTVDVSMNIFVLTPCTKVLLGLLGKVELS